jgi:hypothetical protein
MVEWELNRMFQDIWTTKLPWEKAMMGLNVKLSMVKCKVYTFIKKKTSCFSQNLMAYRNMLDNERLMLQSPM